ncbi:c2h2 type zinc finger containing [Fusarium albosuccineum]|uniref:C2h2 type zinc finger containing n=1 Tax=Fusarium albosuccineum TaxID=1237068 RepID=A0A8H4L179_9HYPO|nr:c2h2 type zinc finger containing [Fusarium albosuccineum]
MEGAAQKQKATIAPSGLDSLSLDGSQLELPSASLMLPGETFFDCNLDSLFANPDCNDLGMFTSESLEEDGPRSDHLGLGDSYSDLDASDSFLNFLEASDASSGKTGRYADERGGSGNILSEPRRQALSHLVNSVVTDTTDPSCSVPAVKIGNRFSRKSVRILKEWLALHSHHSYPNDQDKRMLGQRTGLNQIQISNWLANARRRGKMAAEKSKSFPGMQDDTARAIDIPRRPGTPACRSQQQLVTNPLQRWVDSPPENEPASARDIARAIISQKEERTDHESNFMTHEDTSSVSIGYATSTSGTGTASVAHTSSAHSHGSNRSSTFLREQRKQRRKPRHGQNTPQHGPVLIQAPKPFQCTFCPETFKTKYDWQRHEKSLHLSPDRWICTPGVGWMLNPATNQICCVFCGQPDPDDAHLESRHNYSACHEEVVETKTFYRKDHLNQHLKLVHHVQFLDWSMNSWKVSTPDLRSRCGFCGITIHNWSNRVDHLGQHFKTGSTMADWKGGWGFDASVLDRLEGAIPPSYELITWELNYFITNYMDDSGKLPSDYEIQLEACRIILASEVSSAGGMGVSAESSWLRDLLMANEKIAMQARFAPLRLHTENRLCMLKIKGKDNLFEQCALEQQLTDFVHSKGSVLDSYGWQAFGIATIYLKADRLDFKWKMSILYTNLAISQLSPTRSGVTSREAQNDIDALQKTQHLPHDQKRNLFLNEINWHHRLTQELSRFVKSAMSMNNPNRHVPTDEELQHQARWMVFDNDDPWNQTAADNEEWLADFKRHVGILDSTP